MMRLEQVRNRVHAMGDHLGGMAAQIREDLLVELDRAIEDEVTKEAERALPVTREWLADRYGKPAKLMNDRVWTVNENFEVREEDGRFVVRRSLGHFVAYVETRGQLLDLLSGLGVTK